MDFLKSIGGKVVGGAVALAVIIAAGSWFMMSPGERQHLLSDTGRVVKAIGMGLGWLAVVGLVPWATFFVIGRVAEARNNLAGAALVFVYTAAEAVLLAWLFGWGVRGAFAWAVFAAATLVAGVYNLFACDWIAEKI